MSVPLSLKYQMQVIRYCYLKGIVLDVQTGLLNLVKMENSLFLAGLPLFCLIWEAQPTLYLKEVMQSLEKLQF